MGEGAFVGDLNMTAPQTDSRGSMAPSTTGIPAPILNSIPGTASPGDGDFGSQTPGAEMFRDNVDFGGGAVSPESLNQFEDLFNGASSRPSRRSTSVASDAPETPPNMIGDLFNAGTSGLNFSVRVQADAVFSSPVLYGSAAELTNGISSPVVGYDVQALDSVGALINVGDTNFVDTVDLAPDLNSISTVNIQTTSSASEVSIATQFGGVLTPGRPLQDEQIFQAADNVITRAVAEGITNDVNVRDLVELEYLEEESSLVVGAANSAGSGEVFSASYVYRANAVLPTPSPGEVIGRYSIADNSSPLPQDRLFLDYNFFHNARITSVGIPVNRWSPGFEKTFLGGNASIEMRAPMAVTLSSRVETAGDDLAAFEFGDIAFAAKALLFQSDHFAWSVGAGLSLPTADDFKLLVDGEIAVRIKNQSVHFLPYTAMLVRPTQNTFIQSFAQLDFDTNGNRVSLDEQSFQGFGGTGLVDYGRLRSQTLLRWNTSVGAFLMKRPGKKIQRLAGVVESHYTATLNRSDRVGTENLAVGDPNRTLNVLNLTAGLHAYAGKSVITLGYGTPVTTDRVFDGELRLFVNRYF